MFKVSLINPPERSLFEGYKYYLPFPLLYLASYLEENGIRTDIIDIKLKKRHLEVLKSRFINYYNLIFRKQLSVVRGMLYSKVKEEIVRKTISSSPDLVGITCMTREYNSVISIASELKKKIEAPIVVGGIHPSLYPEHFIYEKSPVDFVVIGEGEDALLELAKNLESGGSYNNIDGIAYLKNGRCYRTNIRELKDDLLISPVNVYHKLNMKFYTRPHPCITRYVQMSGTQIFTSRGCPYRCIFCSNSLIWKMNKTYRPVRYRPIRSVIEEIKLLKDEYHIDSFYIMDDTFCIEKKRVEEFCSELKNQRLNLIWAAETRSNLVDESLLKIMKKTGLVQLDIGVESGSNEILQEIKKGISVEDTLNIFSLMHKYGIRGFANLMVNHPNETLEQLQETISLLENIRASSGTIGITVPLPKTELFNRYVADKIINDEEIVNLIDKETNYYKITDKRFHFAKYNINLEKLISKLMRKHFRFAALQLGPWYWKAFFKSKRKPEYILSIILALINFLENMILDEIPEKIGSFIKKDDNLLQENA